MELQVFNDIAIQPVTKENRPSLYENGSAVNNFKTEGLFTISNKSEVSFINSYDNLVNKFLRLAILPCQPEKLEDGKTCADENTVKEFYARY